MGRNPGLSSAAPGYRLACSIRFSVPKYLSCMSAPVSATYCRVHTLVCVIKPAAWLLSKPYSTRVQHYPLGRAASSLGLPKCARLSGQGRPTELTICTESLFDMGKVPKLSSVSAGLEAIVNVDSLLVQDAVAGLAHLPAVLCLQQQVGAGALAKRSPCSCSKRGRVGGSVQLRNPVQAAASQRPGLGAM